MNGSTVISNVTRKRAAICTNTFGSGASATGSAMAVRNGEVASSAGLASRSGQRSLPAMESEAKAGSPQSPVAARPHCLPVVRIAPEGKQSRHPNAAFSHWEASTKQQRACEVVVSNSIQNTLRASEKIDYPNFVIGLIVTNHDSRSGFLSNRFSNSRMACLLRDTPAL